MEFVQFYLGCLAHASYLIGSEGEAAVVDPRRDVDEYLEEARVRRLAIRYVIETHLHADFVSGHRELAERTGAEIVFGARAGAGLPHRAVREGDELRIGTLVLRFLETPGHTPESICILVTDTGVAPEPRMVLTGDTLFIGDVGRPDLVGAKGFAPETMAGMLYDSLHGKILKLPDAVEVYPAHGAGSLCGRNMSSEKSSTIGQERRTNYALQPMSRANFIKMMTADLPEAPSYFPLDVALNRQGAAPLRDHPLPPALAPEMATRLGEQGATFLDVRPASAFGAGHVPRSVNIGLSGQFASWAGTLLPAGHPLLIVGEDEAGVREAVTRLARVGLESVAGYLQGGLAAWDRAGRPVWTLPQITVDELRARVREGRPGLQVVDVRRPGEYAAGHVPGALSRPLDRLEREIGTLDPARPTAVICAGGYRSSAATSLLRPRGFSDLSNVVGGTSAWIAAGYEVETQSDGPKTGP
ncbi:MAG TPA: rhodanese-like domain-containing protein [Vicinamibacteria bacterium]|nr:rhodanese-like domain-containing protein [Vicinamibacteria bacterium]